MTRAVLLKFVYLLKRLQEIFLRSLETHLKTNVLTTLIERSSKINYVALIQGLPESTESSTLMESLL